MEKMSERENKKMKESGDERSGREKQTARKSSTSPPKKVSLQ
jgi:hypothetical protein